MHTCSRSRLGGQLYAPLCPVHIPISFTPMQTAALVPDVSWTTSQQLTCACNPVVLFSISSSPISLYLLSSIIISLVPIEHCSKDYLASILLTRQGLRCWDAPRNLNPLPLDRHVH